MGNLRDQLKNAKLLSDKKARQLAHEERVHRKQVGREGVEREQQERQVEISERRAAERERTRLVQAEVEHGRQAAAERAACLDIMHNEVVRPRGRGGRRWYFEVEDGSLPWFEVEDAMRFELESGAYWVLRTGAAGSHAYGLLSAEQASRVGQAMPEVVAWAPGRTP